jgi:hypothetical protein
MQSILKIPVDNLNYLRCKTIMSSKKKFEILKEELMNYNEIELIEFDNKYKSLVYTEYNKLFDKLDKLDKKLCSRNVKNTDYENYEKQKKICDDFVEMEGKFYDYQ